MKDEYSDEDSDCTENETLVMLNFPQINFDETKLKLLNVIRKREKNETVTISGDLNNKEICFSETAEEESTKENPRKRQNVDVITSVNSSCCEVKKKLEKTQTVDTESKDDHGEINIKNEQKTIIGSNENTSIYKIRGECGGRSGMKINKHEQVQEENEKDKDNKKTEKEGGKEKKNDMCHFPFEIRSICLENIFGETPSCVLNNKYAFKGMHTSSIGTNLFFKEPESAKKEKESDNEDTFFNHVLQKNMKNESIMTREDFATYEGHSTKIITFEIDY